MNKKYFMVPILSFLTVGNIMAMDTSGQLNIGALESYLKGNESKKSLFYSGKYKKLIIPRLESIIKLSKEINVGVCDKNELVKKLSLIEKNAQDLQEIMNDNKKLKEFYGPLNIKISQAKKDMILHKNQKTCELKRENILVPPTKLEEKNECVEFASLSSIQNMADEFTKLFDPNDQYVTIDKFLESKMKAITFIDQLIQKDASSFYRTKGIFREASTKSLLDGALSLFDNGDLEKMEEYVENICHTLESNPDSKYVFLADLYKNILIRNNKNIQRANPVSHGIALEGIDDLQLQYEIINKLSPMEKKLLEHAFRTAREYDKVHNKNSGNLTTLSATMDTSLLKNVSLSILGLSNEFNASMERNFANKDALKRINTNTTLLVTKLYDIFQKNIQTEDIKVNIDEPMNNVQKIYESKIKEMKNILKELKESEGLYYLSALNYSNALSAIEKRVPDFKKEEYRQFSHDLKGTSEYFLSQFDLLEQSSNDLSKINTVIKDMLEHSTAQKHLLVFQNAGNYYKQLNTQCLQNESCKDLFLKNEIAGLLIAPMQRMVKYNLLLERLAKTIPQDNKELNANLSNLISIFRNITINMNSKTAKE